jgi:hypothetical protein
MHNTINYSQSEAPNFDAVQDVMDWFGPKYNQIAPMMAKVTDCYQFACYCGLAGVSGFPVKAWYEHFHGQGSWKEIADATR